MEYIQLNILELLDIYGEEQLNERLSNFICPKNKDVEDFIQHKAIEFAKQRVAISHLVFSKTDSPVLLGYFTLANKFISITGNTLSKTLQKKISKFSQYDQELERHIVSMPLIAQLGKNFAPEAIGKIAGKTLLDMACNKVQEAQFMIGGKAVYIECANSDKLHDFYTDSQFVSFGQRQCDKDEFMEETILVQMLKYFKN